MLACCHAVRTSFNGAETRAKMIIPSVWSVAVLETGGGGGVVTS